MLQIARNIRLVRKVAELTQTDFAKMFTGVTTAMIKSYEGEKANPDDILIEEIADFAGVTEKELKNKKLTNADLKLKVEKVEKVKDDIVTVTTNRAEESQTVIELQANVNVLLDYILKMKAELFQKDLRKVADEYDYDFEQQLRKLKKKSS